MMAACVKTGLNVASAAYKTVMRGDLHEIGDVFVIRLNPRSLRSLVDFPDDEIDADIDVTEILNFPGQYTNTLVCRKEALTPRPRLLEYWAKQEKTWLSLLTQGLGNNGQQGDS